MSVACRTPIATRSCSNARFTGVALDHVLNQLIETRLVTDRDFVAWHDEHAAEVVAPNRCDTDARRFL